MTTPTPKLVSITATMWPRHGSFLALDADGRLWYGAVEGGGKWRQKPTDPITWRPVPSVFQEAK